MTMKNKIRKISDQKTLKPNRALTLGSKSAQAIRPSLIALAIAQAIVVPSTRAADIVVDNNLDAGVGCTLRDAVTAMNDGVIGSTGCVNSNVNSFGTDDQILLGAGLDIISLTNGALDINRDLLIRSISSNITIQGDGNDRIMTLDLATNTLLEGLTLTGGAGVVSGGAIYVRFGDLVLNDCTISNNTASYGGGGINARNARVTLNNSSVINNQVNGTVASANGGGILAFGNSTLSINNSSVSGNTAVSSGSFARGGGLHIVEGSLSITNSTFSNNYSSLTGGGISISNASARATISNSTISANSATNSGGIFIAGGASAVILNSTISGNSASVRGGGIDVVGSASLTLINSIVANSDGGYDCSNISSTINAASINIIEDGSCATDALSVDPKLGPLRDNGGTTLTHALLSGSPAIGTAFSLSCGGPPVNNVDQRGKPRLPPAPAAGFCDLGAYEFVDETSFFVVPVKNGKAVIFSL